MNGGSQEQIDNIRVTRFEDLNRATEQQFANFDKNIPVTHQTETIHLKDHQKTCAICITDFEPADEVRLLPCSHNYHKPCIDEWLKRNFTCPECRTVPVQTQV